jgi:hypothetical protein
LCVPALGTSDGHLLRFHGRLLHTGRGRQSRSGI